MEVKNIACRGRGGDGLLFKRPGSLFFTLCPTQRASKRELMSITRCVTADQTRQRSWQGLRLSALASLFKTTKLLEAENLVMPAENLLATSTDS